MAEKSTGRGASSKASDQPRPPKTKVETEPEKTQAPEDTEEPEAKASAHKPAPKVEPAAEQSHASSENFGETAKETVRDGVESASNWLDQLFPGHGNAVLFAIVGFVAALLLFQIGFWRTLLIVILVIVGVAYGQYLDGDPKILRSFQQKFGNKK